jgi:hypothetical protein
MPQFSQMKMAVKENENRKSWMNSAGAGKRAY